jgi:serine/threonine protein phosphatase PrpC
VVEKAKALSYDHDIRGGLKRRAMCQEHGLSSEKRTFVEVSEALGQHATVCTSKTRKFCMYLYFEGTSAKT